MFSFFGFNSISLSLKQFSFLILYKICFVFCQILFFQLYESTNQNKKKKKLRIVLKHKSPPIKYLVTVSIRQRMLFEFTGQS